MIKVRIKETGCYRWLSEKCAAILVKHGWAEYINESMEVESTMRKPQREMAILPTAKGR